MDKKQQDIIGDVLICLGKALKAQSASADEFELVFDSIISSPKDFQELYNDFLAGTLIDKVADADSLLRKLIAASNIDKDKYDAIRKQLNS